MRQTFSQTEWNIYTAICQLHRDGDRISIGAIATLSGVFGDSTITGTIDRLEGAGLVATNDNGNHSYAQIEPLPGRAEWSP